AGTLESNSPVLASHPPAPSAGQTALRIALPIRISPAKSNTLQYPDRTTGSRLPVHASPGLKTHREMLSPAFEYFLCLQIRLRTGLSVSTREQFRRQPFPLPQSNAGLRQKTRRHTLNHN